MCLSLFTRITKENEPLTFDQFFQWGSIIFLLVWFHFRGKWRFLKSRASEKVFIMEESCQHKFTLDLLLSGLCLDLYVLVIFPLVKIALSSPYIYSQWIICLVLARLSFNTSNSHTVLMKYYMYVSFKIWCVLTYLIFPEILESGLHYFVPLLYIWKLGHLQFNKLSKMAQSVSNRARV